MITNEQINDLIEKITILNYTKVLLNINWNKSKSTP